MKVRMGQSRPPIVTGGLLVGALLIAGVTAAAPAQAARYGYVTPSAVLRASGIGVSDAPQGLAVSVSADGQTIAVGAVSRGAAPLGRVYIWSHRVSSWALTATLAAPVAGAYDLFGQDISLSADGDHLAVGDRDRVVGGRTYAGAVYTYSRTGAAWHLGAQILDPGTGLFDEFGQAVAMSADGSAIVVGALGDGADRSRIGTVWTYRRSPNTTGTPGEIWTPTGHLTGGTDQNELGAVAISADGALIAVAAHVDRADANGVGDVLVFEPDASATWRRTSVLMQNAKANIGFGQHLAVSGDASTVVASGPGEPGTGTPSVTVFRPIGPDWRPDANFIAHSSAAYGGFGDSVAVSTDGSTVVVGAPTRSAPWAASTGGAYTFHRDALGWHWIGPTYVTRARGNEHDATSVAISGDGSRLVLGAPGYAPSGAAVTGGAYVVDG